MRQKLLLLAAVVFGILAFIFTHMQIKKERARIAGRAVNTILIQFKRDMTEGEKITKSDIRELRTQRFRTNLKSEVPYSFVKTILGQELATSVKRGETLKWMYLKQTVFSKQKGLAGVVRPGMRAVSVSVDATASVTGLIRPNNHVDVVGTFRFPEMKGDTQFDTITLTILQNVVVLATGTNYGKVAGSSRDARQRGYSTVTLSLTPKEVEMIIFATQKGRLDLSLRNYEDTKVEEELQSVNFKFLQDNIKNYNDERQKVMKNHSRSLLKKRYK